MKSSSNTETPNSPNSLDNNFRNIHALTPYLAYLSLMAIQRAKSGHPGLPLGCAKIGLLLYRCFLKFHPNFPNWYARDRFFLSAGHGSMLLYSLNYLFGFPIPLNQIANFRQLHSSTPGHPELNFKTGVETSTGPLGQGFANAVGAALEAKHLNSLSNDKSLFDYHVFSLFGDGCLMEGLTNEAASLAGHLNLDNFIAIYDSNQISIDGKTQITLNENVADKFSALNFDVHSLNSNQLPQIHQTISKFLTRHNGKPKLLILNTTIGEGLPQFENTPAIHGQPPGIDAIENYVANCPWLAKLVLNTHPNSSLKNALLQQLKLGNFLPKKTVIQKLSVQSFFANQNNVDKYHAWQQTFQNFTNSNSPQAKQLKIILDPLPNLDNSSLESKLLLYRTQKPGDASRNLSSDILQIAAAYTPKIVGGSADLVASTKATIKNQPYMQKNAFQGRNIAFGVREHAMAAVSNGLALNKNFLPFSSTFLVFFDYMKPAVRLAALMHLRHLFIFTHDSFFVGEDGPTHQPIEHLGALRLIPNLFTFRPANDVEMALAYLFFLKEKKTVSILASRQNLEPELFQKATPLSEAKNFYQNSFKKGAYIFSHENKNTPIDLVLAGSGSEIGSLFRLKKHLTLYNKNCRIVSIPCLELLEQNGKEYFLSLFHHSAPVFLLEASSHRAFAQFYDSRFFIKHISNFAYSAPAEKISAALGFDDESLFNQVNQTFFQNKLPNKIK